MDAFIGGWQLRDKLSIVPLEVSFKTNTIFRHCQYKSMIVHLRPKGALQTGRSSHSIESSKKVDYERLVFYNNLILNVSLKDLLLYILLYYAIVVRNKRAPNFLF